MSSALDTPCPPFYSVPTHLQHPNFAEGSFVRLYNDWYECLVQPYCNSPTFLGYNPPGEGSKWTQAWKKLDEGFPCNPNLDSSGSSSSSNSASSSSSSSSSISNSNSIIYTNPFSITPEPTSRPTSLKETPSLISGRVWYDANGDGRVNTPQNAMTTTDRTASQNERGAGIGNMRITLRNCADDMLIGVTYTFPRSLGSSTNGGIEIVNADYLAEINQQQLDSITYGGTGEVNTGLGYGNVNNDLGYYSFRVLPSYLPGNFYVVFEAPEGYRLTTGSGDYWEVQEAGKNDVVQPILEATWNDNNNNKKKKKRRNVQEEDEDNGEDDNKDNTSSNFTIPIIPATPDKVKHDIINHSGYYARSKECIFIKESPTTISGINYGLTKDSWPLSSFQYASFVLIIEFFAPSRRRQRNLQLVDSLECRKYQKLKGEGVEVEDIWGCETPLDVGGGKQFDFAQLTIEQGDYVISTITDYLTSRASRAWTVKDVSLAWQDVVEFNIDDDRRLDESPSSSSSLRGEQIMLHDQHDNIHNRSLQNQQLAQLELGIRVRAEFQSDKAKTQDLADVLMSSIEANPTALLSTLKANVNIMPPYFRIAGALQMRRIMWKPTTPPPTPVPRVDILGFVEDTAELDASSSSATPSIGDGQMYMIIGIVLALVVFLVAGIGLAVYMYVRRKHLPPKGARSRRASLQANNRRAGLQRERGGRLNVDDDSDFYDDEDSLSSRWYSDYDGSDRDSRLYDDDDLSEEDEDSFGAFEALPPHPRAGNVRHSMRQSMKSSTQNKSMRASFQSQSGNGQRSSMRNSMRGSVKGSMRSSMRSSMQSSARSSMRSSAVSSEMRSSRSSAMRSSGRSSARMSMNSGASTPIS